MLHGPNVDFVPEGWLEFQAPNHHNVDFVPEIYRNFQAPN